VVQIHGLALGSGFVRVDQNDLGGQAAEHDGIGKGSADVAGAHDGDSHGFIHGEEVYVLVFPKPCSSVPLSCLPSLAAVLVIATGVLGAVLGPWFLDRLGIDDPALRGTAIGVSAHGLGTATIYQESTEAGAYSGLAMGLSGLITALTLPILVAMFGL
jgi:hypothetical protein